MMFHKMIKYLPAVLIALVSAASCTEKLPEMSEIDEIVVRLSYDSELFSQPLVPIGKVAVLQNNTYRYTAQSGADGVATFSGVVPGTYNLSVSTNLTEDEKLHMTDPPGAGIKVFANGTIGSLRIFGSLEAELTLSVGISSSLVISKIYYNGSKYDVAGTNKNYSNDQYVEIYNNSDEDVEMKGYYFVQIETDSKIPFAEWIEEYVYAQHIFRFEQQTLRPGESIVIAREARDHTVTSPQSIDLSSADYEPRLDESVAGFTPNPEAPQMEIVWYTSIRYFLMSNTATMNRHIAIIKSENEVEKDWESVIKPGTSGTRTNTFKEIPVNTIVDGVDMLPYKLEPEVGKKRFPNKVDASYIMPVDATVNQIGSFITFERKVISEVTLEDGTRRKILKDTNNSLDDFVMIQGNLAIRDYDKPELYVEFEEEQGGNEEDVEPAE